MEKKLFNEHQLREAMLYASSHLSAKSGIDKYIEVLSPDAATSQTMATDNTSQTDEDERYNILSRREYEHNWSLDKTDTIIAFEAMQEYSDLKSRESRIRALDEAIEKVNQYWRFDNNQQHLSGWHDKQDLIEKLKNQSNDH